MAAWSSPVGLPGLATLALGFVLFVASLLVARGRSTPDIGGGGKRSLRSLGGVMLQGLGIAIIGFGPIRAVLPAASPGAIAGGLAVAVLMGGAIALFTSASRAMGRNWAIVAQTRSDHQLVTTGPFARVRHPIYVAMFLFALALAAAFGHFWHLLLGAPIYWFGTARRVAIEERLLRDQFGVAYDDYARRVRRFVPGVI